jgi:hypothetical protein
LEVKRVTGVLEKAAQEGRKLLLPYSIELGVKGFSIYDFYIKLTTVLQPGMHFFIAMIVRTKQNSTQGTHIFAPLQVMTLLQISKMMLLLILAT